MKKITKALIGVTAAAGLTVALASPAAAATLSHQYIWSANCVSGLSYCGLAVYPFDKNPLFTTRNIKIKKPGLIVDCTGWGVSLDAPFTTDNLNRLRINKAMVHIVYGSPAGYQDTVTCR